MAKYIKSYLLFIVSTLGIMFLIGVVMGILAIVFSSSPQALQLALQGGALNIIIQIISFVVGFFCFKFAVKRFVETNPK
jgi:uncharacterized membrane protein (UPF0182 family)